MRRTLILCVWILFISVNIARAQVVLTPDNIAKINQSMSMLKSITQRHPEPLVSDTLYKMVYNGTLKFAPTILHPEMFSSIEKVGEKNIILIWYNIDFVTRVPDVRYEDKESYLMIVLYHEMVHVNEHLSGRHPLHSISKADNRTLYVRANEVWDIEWPAVQKEWQLAKKMGKPYLVPTIALATMFGDNPRSFLTGFYQLRMTGNEMINNPQFGPIFRARYEIELTRLMK